MLADLSHLLTNWPTVISIGRLATACRTCPSALCCRYTWSIHYNTVQGAKTKQLPAPPPAPPLVIWSHTSRQFIDTFLLVESRQVWNQTWRLLPTCMCPHLVSRCCHCIPHLTLTGIHCQLQHTLTSERAGENQEYFHSPGRLHFTVRGEYSDDVTHFYPPCKSGDIID